MQKNKVKIRRDDTVEIVAGKDKNKRGNVVKVLPSSNSVIVRGLNMVSKAMRKKNQQDKGGIIEIEAPIDISNVMVICKKCGKTRVGYEDLGDGKKNRICRKCGEKL